MLLRAGEPSPLDGEHCIDLVDDAERMIDDVVLGTWHDEVVHSEANRLPVIADVHITE